MIDKFYEAVFRYRSLMLEKLSEFTFKHRVLVLLTIMIITGFFAYQTVTIPLITVFDKLWPQGHPYMKLYNEIIEMYGGANVVTVVVEKKEGDIFDVNTLSKIKRITDGILLVKDVNYYQVYSIARSKTKDINASPYGIVLESIMWPEVPKTQEGIEKLKKRIFSSDLIRGVLVSGDGKAALITAGLLEKELDYELIFAKVRELVDKERDETVNIYLGGEPILYGWIYHYKPQMIFIFLITIGLITAILYLYTDSFYGTFIPLVATFVSAFWGLGFFNLMGYNLDPLIMVVPFLISARVLGHSVQIGERFAEEYERTGDKILAAKICLKALFAPGLLAVVADALAVAVVILTPIPLLQELGIACCFWVVSIMISVFILNPVLYSYLPRPKLADSKRLVLYEKWLMKLGYLCLGKARIGIIAVFVIVLVVSFHYSRLLTVGDAHPGSPILWQDSEYNQDVKHINEKFPGLDQMYVVFEGKEADDMKFPEVLKLMNEFQEEMEELPEIGATVSIADIVPRINMIFHDDNPKWKMIPETKMETGFLVQMLFGSSDPGDMDKFVRYDNRDANITLYFKDHRGDTIRKAVNTAKGFFEKRKEEGVTIRLAAGLIGALAAANEVIGLAQAESVALAFLVVFIPCIITYNSLLAGILFMIPIAISNYMTFAYMGLKGIGLNVNTLPISALGIGLGIDYGIYIVSRMMEECRGKDRGYLNQALVIAISTAGRAVTFTATTITLSVITWYFFSSLRFQAEMGFLLALWTLTSMLGGLVLLPIIITYIKPKFIFRGIKGEKYKSDK